MTSDLSTWRTAKWGNALVSQIKAKKFPACVRVLLSLITELLATLFCNSEDKLRHLSSHLHVCSGPAVLV